MLSTLSSDFYGFFHCFKKKPYESFSSPIYFYPKLARKIIEIWDGLYDMVPFLQLNKKREKHPLMSVTFSKVAG